MVMGDISMNTLMLVQSQALHKQKLKGRPRGEAIGTEVGIQGEGGASSSLMYLSSKINGSTLR